MCKEERKAGSNIPVRCASPLATPEVSGAQGMDGECNTGAQLSALSISEVWRSG